MLAPIRSLVSLRRGASAALVAGAMTVAVIFAATPFLIPLVAERYRVTIGTAGLISAAQVTGFAVTTFVAGRWWTPSRAKMVGAAMLGVVFGAGSALTASFAVLLATRVAAGAAAGVFTWLAWADAMRDPASMRRISAIGPVATLVGAPLLAWIGSVGGAEGLYWALAAVPIPVILLWPTVVAGERPHRRRMSPSRSNVLLLVALGVLTLAGSSLFVFVGAFGTDPVGLGAVAVALGFSANAAAGLVGARWRHRPRFSAPWMIVIALSASILVAIPSAPIYYLGMLGWGFAFWMAVPGVLTAIAEWSLVPDERVGDAQSIMAVGRAVGPIIGGVLVGGGASFVALGVFAGAGLFTAAVLVGWVERYRIGRVAPAVL